MKSIRLSSQRINQLKIQGERENNRNISRLPDSCYTLCTSRISFSFPIFYLETPKANQLLLFPSRLGL